MSGLKINWDALGIGASVACAIHCAVLPLLVASLPLFGVNIIHNPAFEYFMIALAFAIGSNALWHGYQKHHHSNIPLLLFTSGIILLLAKQFWHQYELFILPFAVIGIVGAHIINLRFGRSQTHVKQEIENSTA
ncbi:MAG: MerC domain-containing protein [Bacteroidetes bacterium]|nr:MerC domain-containing protein [Bacteroidota bacterium]